ncbi:MAG: hypothetical protein VYD19_06005, partial [Myxococcota bacterium]|nr:hypothetical protein [Myxococcota bacterium]
SPLDWGIDGISEGKGCYPGQEVIERSIALGRAAREPVHLSLSLHPERTPFDLIGCEIRGRAEKPVGTVSSAARVGAELYLLASLRRGSDLGSLTLTPLKGDEAPLLRPISSPVRL